MTTMFLDDATLGPAIAEILRGNDVRCAVAFWGAGAVQHLFGLAGMPADARILCDLSMGATNPDELRLLGAPSNRHLKHVERLHAKVYLSDRGAIICSANASDNGIGFLDVAGLIEAGVRLAPDTTAYGQVEAWLRRLARRAKAIDQQALDRATEAWKRRAQMGYPRRPLPIAPGAPSLLATVAANPERYRGIGFVFTNGRARWEDRDEACEALERRDDERPVKRLSRDDRRKLRKWNIGDLFTDWSEAELDAWPRRFICIHRPRTRVSYWFYERVEQILLDDDRGVVFAERRKGMRTALGFAHGRAAMLATDAPLLERLFACCEEQGHWLCESGEALLRLIDRAQSAQ
ncbi:hypothetical protein QE385_003944 [Sphingomonas sp. SORGH_AS 950]|uniref:phospholipase D family protein n=1 Tax=Sphingomonas sp. SORGH_AS_0950 TaxID=3041792 RepID=UPI00277E8910|nr:phospholipase D family protein [Sphingomonas sp. SORGH_AS_0950]MDQ1159547.1 hypothetical protein [Sphingomonas sp. SORGH_AS_0950]